MILRHLLGHTGVGMDQPHASQPQGKIEMRLDAVTLDDSGDDKDGSRRTGSDD